MTIYSAAIMLILVMDPFGNIPVFISVLAAVDSSKRSRIILREMLIALVILVLFLSVRRQTERSGFSVLKVIKASMASLSMLRFRPLSP